MDNISHLAVMPWRPALRVRLTWYGAKSASSPLTPASLTATVTLAPAQVPLFLIVRKLGDLKHLKKSVKHTKRFYKSNAHLQSHVAWTNMTRLKIALMLAAKR